MNKKTILIIGGAGFIGINNADYLLSRKYKVILADNLSRRGSMNNLKWLYGKWGESFEFVRLDITKNLNKLASLIERVDVVYHFAAQVAVTTSVINPRKDFQNNVLGTFNVLEAIRNSSNKPALLYSSTNKVYGNMETAKIMLTKKGYRYADFNGITETQLLDFHSPYGCSKGAADQYVRDYSRIYGLKTIVFRQSCIYGTHQFGVEDQGWVAWFAISAILDKPITIFGDGFQSRDILYVDDLCKLYELAVRNILRVSGNIYNVGGGPQNIKSVIETIHILERILRKKISYSFSKSRPGDQKIYVSDIRKVGKDLNWKPQVKFDKGLERLILWIRSEEKTLRTLNKK
ncbi:MAG: NAD-dependent epimerase/dehydratase, CDP-paratose 2-epimerase [Parcubacteria group bacterium GW2011_GWC1_39_29]|uniref:NAD-dependent epimerase/dehydratase n=1 Tax=Candidatus Yanofskybacteria bacterium GW2011_GWD1_39_16 TaxID=1619030 RepID=A0A837HSV1_9BACT|nr:MAG: NAD-dependent epimerase/dehydratase [Candidatus Yanofskybacteria bacterium GW2011_GWD1_39_16]KKR14478.1 MAG: NAD-dependent epimerase/dehydratase, CDP-paratose 2-epimerase [Parcubacteria group bacterium GW2011_GWC1_39_29]